MEYFIDLGKSMIEKSTHQLVDGFDLTMYVISDEAIAMVALPPMGSNSPGMKQAAADFAKKLVEERNAVAVIAISDTRIAQQKVKDMETALLIAQMSIPEAEAAGLVIKREAIYCKIETRSQGRMAMCQFYRRENEGNIVLEELKIMPNDFKSMGRISDFFPQQANA